jgi:competence protein ComEC
VVLLCFTSYFYSITFNRKPFLKNIQFLAIFFLLGFLWGEMNFYFRSQEVFPSVFEGKNIIVEGQVEGVPVNSLQTQEFQLSIKKINDQVWQGKVNLSWYKTKYMHIPILKPGEKWRLTVKLKKPRGFRNPGSFDYEAWLFEQNIKAKGYVYSAQKLHSEKNYKLLGKAGWHNWIEQVRQMLGEKWQSFAAHWPLLGVLLAFTIGLTGNITPEQWQVFTNTGTIHLISISGFHINLIAGMAYVIIYFFWKRITFLCERWPAQRAGALGAIIIGAIYSLLAGFSIPTQRSFITLSLFMGGLLFQRKTNLWQCFRWSVLIVTLLDPFAPLNLSFWLTYSAVGIILYAISDPIISTKKSWYSFQYWWPSLKLQLQIFLGLIPFSLFWFSQVSISSLWANLVAIPVTGFLILPLGLISILIEELYFPWAIFFMKMAHYCLEKLYLYLSWISHEHPVIFAWSLSDTWMLLLGVVGVLIILAPRGFPCRWLGFIFWLPLLCPLKKNINDGEAYFSLLDVGQGLASVIQTKNHTVVFDTGPKFSEYFDTGLAVVLPYLRNQHIKKIDALVISHKDLDHSGGLQSILAHMPVNKVWVNDPHILKTAHLCEPDIEWTWDGVTFKFLTKGLEQFTDTNDTSCVLKVSNGSHSILLPGDLETRAEKVLVKNYGKDLQADVLIVGHHGSKTSSSVGWLKAVEPKYGLFATGYLNRYHFPNAVVVARYDKMGIHHYSTTDCGIITVIISKKDRQLEAKCYVKSHPYFWFYH